ncbi:aminoglycoside resistance protein [Mycobacterium sp. ACS1612]|uniref:aminoglycoside phosphotransferase family protein n=1 Tax=Mycobacterium sp. ACS1612 TaxID=1834117 RepID=UPI0008014590|nr:aminoglycoside phosphotransferase family protein [Mycobacterium sp. ACS1612]OBF28931.1 aminoglycoside resistance protein [Mycobacterium sp. ACS1612]
MTDLLEQWRLRSDGEPTSRPGSVVLPVTTSDGVPAVLKIGGGSEHEHLVLRRWGGAGAVRLLSADPRQHAVLLERLHPDSLETLPDIEACEVVAGLYRRLHVAALPQLPTITSSLEQWLGEFEALPRSAPIPHRLVEQAVSLSRELVGQPADTVVHGNLHYANVLAADREPWLAIAPRPANGDPHYELAPMLSHRWDELAGGVRDGLRRRFYTLVDAAGFDEDKARAWVLVRVVHQAVRELSDAAALTKYVALAKAVQD